MPVCVCAHKVLDTYKHLQVSEIDRVANISQPSEFPSCKTLNHPPWGWSHSQAMGTKAHPEWGPTAGQGGLPTMVRGKRDGRIKSGFEFHSLLID